MDPDVFGRIGALVEQERELRERHGAEGGLTEADLDRLHSLEEQLDQCWDLLRQRRAQREFGGDPQQARVRDAETVERYEQ